MVDYIKRSSFPIIYCVCAFFSFAQAMEYMPYNLIQLDNIFGHHVIVVEKSTHKLFLFEQKDGSPSLVKEYRIVTGKKRGDKIFQGDFRTPEGIYRFTEFLTHDELINRHGKAGEMYGVGAFVLNYPNSFDDLDNKTGSGIWLHSTNDETRIEKGLDSRGCVVASNKDLIGISEYIELNRTPIIIVNEFKFLNKDSWIEKRDSLNHFLNGWLTAWKDENLKNYISHYHEKLFKDDKRGAWKKFRDYKSAVFSMAGKPEIEISNINILTFENFAEVSFIQKYKSDTIEDTGRKILSLIKDEHYEWKIINETWTKRGLENPEFDKISFRPSMRFFKTSEPEQIVNFPIKGQN